MKSSRLSHERLSDRCEPAALVEPWSGQEYRFAHDIGPKWSDTMLWDYAQQHGLTIVTKDADYAERALRTSSAPLIIHFRTGNLTMAGYHQIVAPAWQSICEASRQSRIVEVYRDRIECIGSVQ